MNKKIIHWAEPSIGEEEITAVKEALTEGWIGGNGPRVKEFEKQLATYTGAKYAIATNNGTSALLCAMQALREVGYPMEFLVPTLTFFATGATAYEMNNKGLHFIDCDRRTFNMLTDIEEYQDIPIILPVDVGGLPVEYDELQKHGTFILADSAESFGSLYKGQPVGAQAHIHIFSFHSAKVLAIGEGGAITTNSKQLYEIMKSIANQGYGKKEPWEYKHERLGFNYRMPELQAAIGLEQLKKLPRFIRHRTELAKTYKDILGDLVEYQEVPKHVTHNYFLFIILTQKYSAKVCKELYARGIEAKQMWTPLHQQAPFSHEKAAYPNAEYINKHGILLPIHNKLTEEDVKQIAETVKQVIK